MAVVCVLYMYSVRLCIYVRVRKIERVNDREYGGKYVLSDLERAWLFITLISL